MVVRIVAQLLSELLAKPKHHTTQQDLDVFFAYMRSNGMLAILAAQGYLNSLSNRITLQQVLQAALDVPGYVPDECFQLVRKDLEEQDAKHRAAYAMKRRHGVRSLASMGVSTTPTSYRSTLLPQKR